MDNRPMNSSIKSSTKIYEKPKNFKISLSKLIGYCKSYLFIIVLAIIFAIFGAILTLIGPNQFSKITNIILAGLTTGINTNAVLEISIFLACLYILSSVFNYAQGIIMANVTQKISKTLRKDISYKINKLPLKYLDSTTYGNILSRVTNDVDTIGQTLNNSVTSLISSIVLLIGAILMMFITNWIMAFAAIGASIVGFVLMAFIMSKSQKYFNTQQKSLGELNGHVEEIYTGHNVVKAYNGEAETKQKFTEINNKLYTSAWKSQFFSGLMHPLMNFIGNFGYVAVCVTGAVLTMNGDITFGVIIAFMVYVRLFMQPISQLTQAFTNLQSTVAASERVFEFLGEQELSDESDKTKVLNNIKGNVEFKNVKFGYDADKEVIHNFSASIRAGQKVAIVGPTGAGKTTIVNLLMKFYEVDSGNILIDGVSILDLKRENVHDLFSMVLQDTWLFEGTIKQNIIYSKHSVTDEQIVEVCKACGVHHFIKTLPQGYDTVLDDNTAISAGQKQLLTIARAMIQNSPMLILDEATSNVDTRTEILIQQAMDKLTIGRTSFVIAHRLSTIKNADKILVMKDGDIVEQGSHDELLSENGFYAELYNSQF
ncbi:MAG: ABC transporter ATP-binding protein/permease [Clostridia bacterium]|jgi:ATP-binding cassette subfamily B protein|nr:ABC transporter ATP-binding protein/permease [Clostridia bacterium]